MNNTTLLALTMIGALMTVGGIISIWRHIDPKMSSTDLLSKQSFEAFKTKHNKAYSSLAEEEYRLGVYQQNMDYVKTLNALDSEVTLGASQFSDQTNEEFRRQYLGLKPEETEKNYTNLPLTLGDDPKSLDWRKSGAVTSVKNQGMCGSCWAFSACGAIESGYFQKTNKLQDVSVQQVTDCATDDGSEGCNGGFMTGAMKYVERTGLQTWDDYKYTGRDQKCTADSSKFISDLKLKSHTNVPKADSDQLKAYLIKRPVSIGLDANILQFYLFGVVNLLPCSTEINHGVLLVGYDRSWLGTDYWIVKNSWGSFWGERGYFRIRRDHGKGVGKCGLTEQATQPNF